MREPIGYVVNPERQPISVRRVLVSVKEPVEISSLLVAVAEDANRRATYYYLLRVRDLQFYSPVATAAAVDVAHEVLGEKITPELVMNRVGATRLAITEVVDVGYEDSRGLRPLGPKLTPLPGTPVYLPDRHIVEKLLVGTREKPIPIGILAGTDIDVTIDASPKKLARHMIIVGTTGAGKSWLRGVLLERFHEAGIPQLLFDPLEDYVDAVEQLGGVNLRYGDNFLPRLESLEHRMFRALLYDVLTPLQLNLAVRAFKRYQAIARKSRKPLNPRMILNFIESIGKELRAMKETIENTKARVEVLLDELGYPEESRGLDKHLTGTDEAKLTYPDWRYLISDVKLVNIDLAGVDDTALQVTVASVLSEIQYLVRTKTIPPPVVTFDEAHRIVPRTSAKTPPPSSIAIKNLIRYGRHFGIPIIAITQFPDSVDREVVRLPATRFIFAIDADQLESIRGLLRDLPREIADLLPRLEVGTAFLTGTADVVRHTILVKITSERKTTHGGETPDLMNTSINRR